MPPKRGVIRSQTSAPVIQWTAPHPRTAGGLSAVRVHCVHCVRPILALLDEIDWGSGTMKITMKTMKISLKSGPQITERHTKGHQMPPSIVYRDRPHLYLQCYRQRQDVSTFPGVTPDVACMLPDSLMLTS